MRVAVYFVLPLLILALVVQPPPAGAEENLPVSKEASFVESYSATEWMIKAAGIGGGKKKEQEENAVRDARKSAVYFCLFMGSDPILSTPEEKKRFEPMVQDFFNIDNINKFIAWESEEYTARVKMADKRLKIEKVFRVNVGRLKEELTARGVLMAAAELQYDIGLPFIVVLPEVEKGGNPLQAMQNRQDLKWASRSIESYLTALKYEAKAPEQIDFMNNYAETMQAVEGLNEDLSAKIASAIGSDVYINFTVNIDKRHVGSSEVKKAMVTVRAYETTTERLLGTETGYSFERAAPDEVVTEEAIHDAIDKVLARINDYWKKDLQRGVQYRIIFSITGNFDEDQIEDIQFALADVLDKFANRTQENMVTDQRIDYLVWAKPDKYTKARDLYRDIREGFAAEYRGAKIKQQQLNKKLIMLEITNN